MRESKDTIFADDFNACVYKPRAAIFPRTKIVTIIQGILRSKLEGKTYRLDDVRQWTKDIADDINTALYDLHLKHFKHVVQVVISQQMGSGFVFKAKTRWDKECDTFATDHYITPHLFCVCTVFGTYTYVC